MIQINLNYDKEGKELNIGEQMGPLQVSDHMVQKPPYWNANCALGHLNKAR